MISKKFKNGYLRLIILMLISLVAGLHLVISPETVSHWAIRGVGLIWTMEAISSAIEVVKKYIKSKQCDIHVAGKRYSFKEKPQK
jgi:hypothetical protein